MCLCFSLFFTYPVMMFPVVQIIEKRTNNIFSSYMAGVSIEGICTLQVEAGTQIHIGYVQLYICV